MEALLKKVEHPFHNGAVLVCAACDEEKKRSVLTRTPQMVRENSALCPVHGLFYLDGIKQAH